MSLITASRDLLPKASDTHNKTSDNCGKRDQLKDHESYWFLLSFYYFPRQGKLAGFEVIIHRK